MLRACLRIQPLSRQSLSGVRPSPGAETSECLQEWNDFGIADSPTLLRPRTGFQDNELLDHEGPPTGQPQIPGVCRVHYRAPTEGGNSGSPVFNAAAWQVVALHHKGGRFGMPRLNGQSGTYAANEGLAMATLVAAVKAPAT